MKKTLILLVIFLLTGCYNYTEINNIKLVDGIYIDYKENKYLGNFDVDEKIKVEGSTINEIFRNFEENISKKPYYAHLKILIISKEVLHNHFDEVIEFFLRNNEIRNNFYLLISENIKELNSNYIKSMINNEELIPTSILFKDILTTYLDHKKIIIPIIKQDKKKYVITGSILKNKNSIKEYNLEETRLLRILFNKNPNINYQNINIYKSKIKNKDKFYINLDAELKENNNKNVISNLKKDLDKLVHDIYNKKMKLKIDINRNGQILSNE